MVSSSSKWIFLKVKAFLDNCIWLHFFHAWYLNKNEVSLVTTFYANIFRAMELWCFTPLSTIFQRSVLLGEETRLPGENHPPVTSHWQTSSHMLYGYTLPWTRFELKTIGMIGTNCTCSCKSNYLTTTMSPYIIGK